eukprot:UN33877
MYEKSQDVYNHIEKNLKQFTGEKGLILLLYSMMYTRGLDNIKKEAELPLIVGPFTLATTDVLSLFLRGTADGNVGAFTQTGNPNKWPKNNIGLISSIGHEQGIPISDNLKFPQLPVWILHGGDHFTVLFQTEKQKGAKQTYYHWNGLPPGGPRLSKINIHAIEGDSALAPKNM